MINTKKIYGGIEAGGTKFICAVGNRKEITAQIKISTTTPQETLAQAINFFQPHLPLAGIGIASFGPLDLNPLSPTFGFITSTPKPNWQYTDLVGVFQKALNTPVILDTDVNGAALSEREWGVAQRLNTLLYLTIGTGIGGGGIVNGKLMHGLVHPEMGHIPLPHDRARDPFAGSCPYHQDCLEGLASGTALLKRWGAPAESLAPDHPAWDLEAHYLGLALCTFITTLSPQRIILGGSVMKQSQLLPLIQAKTQAWLNGYVQAKEIVEDVEKFIVLPALGDRAGILGALALAQNLHRSSHG